MKSTKSYLIVLALFLAVYFLMPTPAFPQMGMKYLSPGELPAYDFLLKNQGHPELTTIFAVYDDSFDPPRAGLKCLNKKNQRFEVYITGGKVVRINKIPGKGRW